MVSGDVGQISIELLEDSWNKMFYLLLNETQQ